MIEIEKDLEQLKEMESKLLEHLKKDHFNDIDYYTMAEKELENQDEKDFCRQRIRELEKGYDKQVKKIKENFEWFRAVVCY